MTLKALNSIVPGKERGTLKALNRTAPGKERGNVAETKDIITDLFSLLLKKKNLVLDRRVDDTSVS